MKRNTFVRAKNVRVLFVETRRKIVDTGCSKGHGVSGMAAGGERGFLAT